MNKIVKGYFIFLGIYGISLKSPLLALTASLFSIALLYKFHSTTKTKTVLVGSRLDSKSIQLETMLRMNCVPYYHLQNLEMDEYFGVLFGGYLTREGIFHKPVVINYPEINTKTLLEPGVQSILDEIVEVMMDDFVPLLTDMDEDAMANDFVNEHGSMLPSAVQLQMCLTYKYHLRLRYLQNTDDIMAILNGKTKDIVLKELVDILDTFFTKKSLLFDNWTIGTASIFSRMLLISKYCTITKTKAEFNRQYPHLAKWIKSVECSLHGDGFPFPYDTTKIDQEIHMKAMKPLFEFVEMYFVPFMLMNEEKYKELIKTYNQYSLELEKS